MLDRNDERCIWLDARFKKNPAWLADEAEALTAKSSSENELDGLYDNPSFTPPTASHCSASNRSVEFNLPSPPNLNTIPRPRGIPDIDGSAR
jgi:hypothetical protein